MSKISRLKTKTLMQGVFKKLLKSFHKEDDCTLMNEYMKFSIGSYSTDYEDIRIFFYYYPVGSWDKDIGFYDILRSEKANKEETVVVEIINEKRKEKKLIKITESLYKKNGFIKYKKEIEDYLKLRV